MKYDQVKKLILKNKKNVMESNYFIANSGRVEIINVLEDCSTTSIINKL
tara:strand:- start:381 stop:527 length:147 start_codon:yes stop_codon:yes gene_type:complete